MDTKKYKTVDQYIAAQPKEVQDKLKAIRQLVKELAPKAEEKISYNMPYFGLNGRLLYYAAAKDHIGFYPMPSAVREFKAELKNYGTSTGTVRFPFNKPLPTELIKKMVLFRIQQNQAADGKSSYSKYRK